MILTKLFQKPSAKTLAQQDLEESQRQLLAYQSEAERCASMSAYLQEKINRLNAYLQTPETVQAGART
jgi:hypothetical protein